MFKECLKEYLKLKGISQNELSILIGDTQQAISDFLIKDGNPQKKTREKYFKKLEGFKEYYINKTSLIQDKKYFIPDINNKVYEPSISELINHYNKLLNKVNKTIEELEKDVDGLDGYKELTELIKLKEEIQLKLNSLK